ncbi:D-alanyl-D-alanine carboxypeptidase/D-alanyl-D-alanine endopeptidase [Longimicrobium sp.]|uniref:D-alanyl-D-alanine carboxypeptidase/D-alanyl-D-alanine endopeptidase n=1 Tax=Longimicrobium sp. TaxID=2029185 RepID=UPI002C36ED46|nr:D-alanyl-D-alanine carboxypeptidase/D-alanyl-D-alanine-endopeptidase [Longimicrobium sp.]HSU16215.1 D-alanyl-D-alanine carboxypeptidase/D-alanyl-D-alanine-endopeptidase [Longimicrobium sp.]
MISRTPRATLALLAALHTATAAPAARAQAAPNLAPQAAEHATGSAPARGATALAARIDAILARPALRRADWGIEVRDAQTGRVLYQRSADRLFIPASNLKLLVTSTAAHRLGADYRYRTTLYGTGALRGGVLEGDLVLYGRGDPLISDRGGRRRTAVWEELADSLLARGIHRVTGGVVADDSYFEAEHLRPDWEAYDLRWWYAAPVGALGFNDNSVQVQIAPGAVGERARVSWQPESGYVEVENRTVTVGSGRPRTADLERVPGTHRIRAYGQVPAGSGTDVEYFAVASGADYAGTTFRETLERKGISLGRADVRVVSDPARSPVSGATPLASHLSDPLPKVIAPILLNSQNWIAETLLKTVGRETRGEGSWDAGLAAEREFLTQVVGIDSSDFRLRDGSGLSAGNLVTPRAFVKLLAYVNRAPEMAIVRASLPVAGREGSLRSRFTDLPGRVMAKTGYIGNVDSLSGFVTTDEGRTVIFSIIANKSGQPSARMKAGIDDVVRAIASTPAS